jgi:hypothetical protein
VNIPYTYLAVLLVFTLLIGVVIGDRLAAGTGLGIDEFDPGRSGACSGLASARLHACVHRYAHLPTAYRKESRFGAGTWPDPRRGDGACELDGDSRNVED